MTSSQSLRQRRAAVVARGVPSISDLAVERGEGSFLVDLDGERVLDFATGIGVMELGHGQPEVVAAICAQAQKLLHTCIHVATYEPYVELCERLVARFPHGPDTRCLLLNSGAEAVENAVKIARQATGRPAVICFTDGFHGRTLLGMSLTSKVGYKLGCGPFAPEVYRLPYPNRFLHGDGLDEAAFVARELARFERALVDTVAASAVACVVIEPVQGEGGFVPCPVGYLQGLRRLCTAHGIALVLDEVQTGFGRTGAWAAYEHAGIVPDLSTWAKAMGGGLPISAVIGRAALMDKALPGTLGGTYGGNPVACAAALATLTVMERIDLPARARALGARMRPRLEALAARAPIVAEVRGVGAMLAIELCEDGDPRRPATKVAQDALRRARARGVLCLAAGAHQNVIRLLPPLTIADVDIDRGLEALEVSVLEASGSVASGAAAPEEPTVAFASSAAKEPRA